MGLSQAANVACWKAPSKGNEPNGTLTPHDERKSDHDEKCVDQERAAFLGLEPPDDFPARGRLRFANLEISDANGAKRETEAYEHAPDDLYQVQRRLVNCNGTSMSASFKALMTACNSSLLLDVTRT